VARAVLGWSQTELARRTAVTQRAIYCIEQIIVRPRKETEECIIEAFGHAGLRFERHPRSTYHLQARTTPRVKSINPTELDKRVTVSKEGAVVTVVRANLAAQSHQKLMTPTTRQSGADGSRIGAIEGSSREEPLRPLGTPRCPLVATGD
jgi:transcriptional regulator with XRE-family HTH domain